MKLPSILIWRANRRFFALWFLVACGTADQTSGEGVSGPPLTIALPMDCDALYPPDFETMYLTTVQPKCALGPCHSAENGQGGLDLSSRDKTWTHFIDEERVIPGYPDQSVLVARLQLENKARRMPPGDGLEQAEICAITQWIYNGAER